MTGLGVGIGSTVVDGALQQIYRVQRRSLTDQLVIRPFPQTVEAKRLWTVYRRDMLDFAGIAIFMFGNKMDADASAPVLSNGVMEEFEIAREKGIKVLPLGFTGFAAKVLYERVATEFDKFYPNATPTFRRQFALLGDPSRSLVEQLRTTLDALVALQRM